MLLDCELSGLTSQPDDPAASHLPVLPVRAPVYSPEITHNIKDRLKICQEQHHECNLTSQEVPILPHRVIDVRAEDSTTSARLFINDSLQRENILVSAIVGAGLKTSRLQPQHSNNIQSVFPRTSCHKQSEMLSTSLGALPFAISGSMPCAFCKTTLMTKRLKLERWGEFTETPWLLSRLVVVNGSQTAFLKNALYHILISYHSICLPVVLEQYRFAPV
jgi:hypothetical protein